MASLENLAMKLFSCSMYYPPKLETARKFDGFAKDCPSFCFIVEQLREWNYTDEPHSFDAEKHRFFETFCFMHLEPWRSSSSLSVLGAHTVLVALSNGLKPAPTKLYLCCVILTSFFITSLITFCALAYLWWIKFSMVLVVTTLSLFVYIIKICFLLSLLIRAAHRDCI